ncbi:hypothetical protein LTR62_006384 [Meristemomyces frigidus]|uniref:Telomeric repeat-binding factor 2-interacting protein 1 n=1 Tax=Meristemomyces frigidus TaxID=1508187 RepID=A0AAN7TCG5_9PEZI|nr:hypothetical protein LTR62_006384 [Meristemomyces frigidus]
MAPLVMSRAIGEGSTVGGLFNGLAFFVLQRVPSRAHYLEILQKNGARVVKIEAQADHVVADHMKKDAPPGSISYTFIDAAIQNSELPDPHDYAAGPAAGAIREVGSIGIPGKTTRTAFTAEDDRVLWQWVERACQEGGMPKGNEIYKQLEARNSRHTYQAWRDRYIKKLMGNPPAGVQVTGAASPPPSPPVASDRGGAKDARKAKQPAVEPFVTESNGDDGAVDDGPAIFTSEDFDSLMTNASDVVKIDPERQGEAWASWAEAFRNHTAEQWQLYWEQTVLPAYRKKRAARGKKRTLSKEASQSPNKRKRNSATPRPGTAGSLTKVKREKEDFSDLFSQEAAIERPLVKPSQLTRIRENDPIEILSGDDEAVVSQKDKDFVVVDEADPGFGRGYDRADGEFETQVVPNQDASGHDEEEDFPSSVEDKEGYAHTTNDPEPVAQREVEAYDDPDSLFITSETTPAADEELRQDALAGHVRRPRSAFHLQEVASQQKPEEVDVNGGSVEVDSQGSVRLSTQPVKKQAMEGVEENHEARNSSNAIVDDGAVDNADEVDEAPITLSNYLIEDGEVEDGCVITLPRTGHKHADGRSRLPGEDLLDDEDLSHPLTEANLATQEAQHLPEPVRAVDLLEDDPGQDQSTYADWLQNLMAQKPPQAAVQSQQLEQPRMPLPLLSDPALDGTIYTQNEINVLQDLPISSQAEIEDAFQGNLDWPSSPQQVQKTPRPVPAVDQTVQAFLRSRIPVGETAQGVERVESLNVVMESSQAGHEPAEAGSPEQGVEDAAADLVEEEEDDLDLAVPEPDGGFDEFSANDLQMVAAEMLQDGGLQRNGFAEVLLPRTRLIHAPPAHIDEDENDNGNEDEDELDLSVPEPNGGFEDALSDDVQPAIEEDDVGTQQKAASQQQIIDISSAEPASSSFNDSSPDSSPPPHDTGSRKRALETQDILDAETQRADLDVPLPPDSDSESDSDDEEQRRRVRGGFIDDDFGYNQSASGPYNHGKQRYGRHVLGRDSEERPSPTSKAELTPAHGQQRPAHRLSIATPIANARPSPVRPDQPRSSAKARPTANPHAPARHSPKPQPSPTPELDLEVYIPTTCLRYKIPESIVITALKATSMRPEAAELVMLELKRGRGIPGDVPGIWSEEEDGVIEGGNATRIKVVAGKHGWEEVEERLEFLREWREG